MQLKCKRATREHIISKPFAAGNITRFLEDGFDVKLEIDLKAL